MNKEAFATINDVEKLKEMIASFVSDFSDREDNHKAEIKILNEQIKKATMGLRAVETAEATEAAMTAAAMA